MTAGEAAGRPRRRWQSPARLLLLALTVPLGVVMIIVYVISAAAQPAAALLAIALLAAAAAVPLLLIRWLSRMPPWHVVVAAMAWGAFVATALSTVAWGLWNGVIAALLTGGAATEWSGAVTAGPVEEAYKLLGVAAVGLAFRGEVRGAGRGCVMGMLVGLGFGTVEDALYLGGFAMVASDGSIANEAVALGFLGRAVVGGVFVHVALTGLAGAVLGWAAVTPSALRGLAVGVALVGMATLHAALNVGPISPPDLPWEPADIPAVMAVGAIRSLPFLATLAVLVVARRTERPVAAAGPSSAGRTGS